MSNVPGTTNDDAPFQPGERIEWCGDVFIVVTNHGRGGTVIEESNGARWEYSWTLDGEKVRRVKP